MAINLKNITIDQCGTGLKTTGNVDLDVDGLSITNTDIAMDFQEYREEIERRIQAEPDPVKRASMMKTFKDFLTGVASAAAFELLKKQVGL